MNKKIIPVMMCFFIMGFVDLVGIASNYVKADMGLSDSVANLLPSLVFMWFLLFAVPTSLLMNRIGRKRMVLLSLVVTLVAMVVPIFAQHFWQLLIAFSLLGIGNTLLQTSLNPLVDTLHSSMSAKSTSSLASTLTFGQFIKAIASFMAPIIAAWGATTHANTLGLGWRVLFPIYMAIGVIATLALYCTEIKEEFAQSAEEAAASKVFDGLAAALGLLKKPILLMCFVAIICHVGIDVGINTTAPKILMERLGWTIEKAGYATSIYFIFRTIGCLAGSFIMTRIKDWHFLVVSIVLMALAVAGLLIGTTQWQLYAATALMGLANSNPFSIIMARALHAVPGKENEASGLMIMGLFGGTLFPIMMGVASDWVGQVGAIAVLAIGVVYLFVFWMTCKQTDKV